MVILLLIILVFLEAYTLFLVLHALAQAWQQKRIAYVPLLLNAIVISGFFITRQKMLSRQWILFGNYNEAAYWGGGLSNLMTSAFNLVLLLFFFVMTQVVFWMFYLNKTKKLNEGDQYRNMISQSFNAPPET